MAIYIGENCVDQVFVGDIGVKEIYAGDTLIYQRPGGFFYLELNTSGENAD